MITESVNDNEEIQEVSARFEEPIEVNVQTISSVDDDEEEEESKSNHSNEENDEKALIANEKVEERSKSDETALPPKYEDEFKEAAFEEVTDENHNKENEVKTEVILPPMEVGGT